MKRVLVMALGGALCSTMAYAQSADSEGPPAPDAAAAPDSAAPDAAAAAHDRNPAAGNVGGLTRYNQASEIAREEVSRCTSVAP